MKYLIWKGNSLQQVRMFPKMVKEDIGFQLDCLQQNQPPTFSQTIPSVHHNAKTIIVSNGIQYYLVYYETQIPEPSPVQAVETLKKPVVDVVYILCAFSMAHPDNLIKNTKKAKKLLDAILTTQEICHE